MVSYSKYKTKLAIPAKLTYNNSKSWLIYSEKIDFKFSRIVIISGSIHFFNIVVGISLNAASINKINQPDAEVACPRVHSLIQLEF